jgi:alpha-glucosidase (family GH31 glycosyl hydrolase)
MNARKIANGETDGFYVLSRGGGIGSQRAPYMWAGDQTRTYSSLGMQLTAVLSSGLSGVPYMSYDMSGYKYGEVRTLEAEGRVFIRGTQFTAYTICMQTHGTVKRAYQFAEADPAYLYITELYRAYVKLHEHLTPYITELCEEASTTGMPVMRHMVLGWQDDPNVYKLEDQYMFGDAFLIAPILDSGTERTVYLPAGSWVDLNTGATYELEEGMTISVTANIAELPTFFNVNTESEIARELVDGIVELYDYARTLAP